MSVRDFEPSLTAGANPESDGPKTSSAVVLEPPVSEPQPSVNYPPLEAFAVTTPAAEYEAREMQAPDELREDPAGEDDFDDEPPPQERFEELAVISDGIETATSLDDLKPLYFQLVDFSNLYKRNSHLEPLITQLQLRLVARGNLMKHAAGNALPAPEEPHAAEPPRTEDLAVIVGAPPPEASTQPTLDAPQPGETMALIPMAPISEVSIPERPMLDGHKHKIKVQPLRPDRPQSPRRKRVVRTLVGIGMGLSMVAGIMVIIRNERDPAIPPGPAVSAAEPAPALPASVQLIADVPHGEILIDGQAAGGLSEGEWSMAQLSPGEHSLILRTESCQATFQFRIAAGGPPTWTKPAQTNGCSALAISSAGKRGSVTATQATPVQLDGQAAGSAGLKSLQLSTLFSGEHILNAGPKGAERRIHLSTREEPSLAFFVEIAGTTGTMVATIEEDGAELLLNRRRTGRISRNGRVRLPLLRPGDYLVTAIKPGFSAPAEQLIAIRRRQEAHVELRLTPTDRAPIKRAAAPKP